jgi:TrmH family RNA methyltransferase
MLGRERLKELVALKEKKYRRRYGRFLVEGPHLLMELARSDWPVEWLLLSPDRERDPELAPALARLTDRGARLVVLPREQLFRLSDVETTQGVLAVCPIPGRSWRPEIGASWRRVLVLDGLQDPGNVGTLIRSAAWFGWDAVLLGAGSADPYSPKAVRSSMGGLFFVPVFDPPLGSVLKELSQQGMCLWGAVVEGGVPFCAIPPPDRVALLIGSEAMGIRTQLQALVQQRVYIPRIGRGVESLNAAVAGGILLAYLSGLCPETSAG